MKLKDFIDMFSLFCALLTLLHPRLKNLTFTLLKEFSAESIPLLDPMGRENKEFKRVFGIILQLFDLMQRNKTHFNRKQFRGTKARIKVSKLCEQVTALTLFFNLQLKHTYGSCSIL